MMVGDPSVFAIDSYISIAYSRLSFRALGYFTIIILGKRYGVKKPDATMLACSLEEVERRLRCRGTHTSPRYEGCSSSEIIEAFRNHYYLIGVGDDELDWRRNNDEDVFYSNNLVWAPDGDSAFDDDSYVLQFDIRNDVRLIGFKARENPLFDPSTLGEVVLKADEFYSILEQWRNEFLSEWAFLPKHLD